MKTKKILFQTMLVILICVFFPTVVFAQDYQFKQGVCTSYPVQWTGWINPTTIVFSAHNNMYVTFSSSNSYNFKRDSNGQVCFSVQKDVKSGLYLPLPIRIYNHYSVRFLDINKKELWQEYNSIPNGGSRCFYIGSNVRYIQIHCDYNYWDWIGGANIGYSS